MMGISAAEVVLADNDWVQVQRLLAQSCELLDQERFDAWLELFTEDAHYEVTAWSPEINREQTWLGLQKAELTALVNNIDSHIRDRAKRGHVAMLANVIKHEFSYEAIARFLLLRTDEMGASTLYLTGTYRDVVRVEPTGLKLAARHVQLDTRLFDIGSHLPV